MRMLGPAGGGVNASRVCTIRSPMKPVQPVLERDGSWSSGVMSEAAPALKAFRAEREGRRGAR